MPRKNYSDGERERRDAQLRKAREELDALEQELHGLWLLFLAGDDLSEDRDNRDDRPDE